MVIWTISKNHLLEVGLTQNRKTVTLQTLTTVDFILFYHVWGPAWREIHWNGIWLRAQSHMASHCTWRDRWPHYMILEVCWASLCTLSFGLSQFHGHNSQLVWEVAPNSPPTLTGAGHQRTVSTNTSCNQWLLLAKTLLKVALYGRNRSMVAHTSKCGRHLVVRPRLLVSGHQRTVSTSKGCNQWLSLAKTLLNATLAGGNRSLVACTRKCGWTISCKRVAKGVVDVMPLGTQKAHLVFIYMLATYRN